MNSIIVIYWTSEAYHRHHARQGTARLCRPVQSAVDARMIGTADGVCAALLQQHAFGYRGRP